jgi:histone-binding protein RBBP4
MVYVFDYSKHGSMPVDGLSKPQHRCLGHTAEGYGLCWNPNEKGQLLSGSDDGQICLWDLREAAVDVQPLSIRSHHSNVVEDVDWHKKHSYMFASVGEDSRLVLWDTREAPDTFTSEVVRAHEGDVHCLAFNPANEFLLATGGADGIVALWDLRNLSRSIHDFKGHMDGVYQVSWSPHNEAILGSSSSGAFGDPILDHVGVNKQRRNYW